MIKVSEEEFQELVDIALDTIPQNFTEKLNNIVFIVEDFPSGSDLERLDMGDGSYLLGLYSGTPYTHRSSWYSGKPPDRIILFQRNIERICNTKDQLKEKIREVMVHEIAHYFGMNEDEIRDAGY